MLSSLNDTIGPWYRYESGTSMAAPAVSGTLALMQDYFTNTLHATPSPALLKAMLINGARAAGNYDFTVTNAINFQGWGLANVPDSLPAGITNVSNVSCSSLFLEQSPTNALATGDSQSFTVAVSGTDLLAQSLPLRVTLAWTDPPGNPVAATKLVNNLDLMVSNNVTGDVFFGNDIPSSSTFNEAWNTNSAPNLDSVNNVENVFIRRRPVSVSYTVTVIGRSVNVNAVTAQTNNVVQDYALVIACGKGEAPDAITVTPGTPPSVSNPTSDQQITLVNVSTNGMATNSAAIGGVFLNQLAGANTPLLGTNTVGFATSTNLSYATNAVVTLGMTNQWHFYVVQNTASGGLKNAGFVTFLPDTLSIPRMGVFANSDANSTQPEADIDMYVSTDPTLTNLNPNVISNCVNGTQVGGSAANIFNGASLSRGGTEFVVDTNSAAGQIYYVGVKSETAEAAEYGFLPVFSQQPFSGSGPNGEEIVNGLLLPASIPDGSPAHPGMAYVFALAIQPIEVQDVIVSNQIVHQNFGDLTGAFSHNGKSVILNNHDSLDKPPGPYNFTYDDGPAPVAGSQPPDGPGTLQTFQGQQGIGPWILTEVDNALAQTGTVTALTVTITPHQDLTHGKNIFIAAHSYFYGFIDVPPGATNLTIAATNVSGIVTSTGDFTAIPPDNANPGQLFEKLGEQPVPPPTPPTNYDKTVILNNGTPPGGSISIGPSDNPPIQPGRYFVTLYNASAQPQEYYIIATLGIAQVVPVNFSSTGPVPLLDDAVSYAYITNFPTGPATNETIAAINVGIRVDHPRISDLVFHLISPDGTRYLLMENRGGTSTNGAGVTVVTTNIVNVSSSGSTNENINFVNVGETSGTIAITYNFYILPDQMTIYYGTNIAPANLIYDSGMTSNPGNVPRTISIGFGPTNSISSTYLTIIMNQYTNSDAGGDLWTYNLGGLQTNFLYLAFTEDTNLTTTPIKFAPPPFVPGTVTNLPAPASTNIPIIAGPILNPGNGHYYYLLGNTNWTGSEVWAEALGGHLTTIRNATENAWVLNTFSQYNGTNYELWIGFYCPQEEDFTQAANYIWADGESVTYTNWNTGEPNLGNGADYYVYMYGLYYSGINNFQGRWNNINNVITNSTEPSLNGVAEVVPDTTGQNLYYQPEQDISPLIGTSAYGLWTLEIQDDRVGATNNTILDSWQLQFIFADTNQVPATLPGGTEICNPIPANGILWYQVNVPLNAIFATNTLFSSDQPVNLLFNSTAADTNGATTLLSLSTNGFAILSTTNGTPLLVPGATYFLGVQNPNSVPVVDACIEVDFDLLATAFAFTEPAQLVTGTSAQLNGFATPNGQPSTAWFQWGTTTNYGNQTANIPVGAGYNVVYTTGQISGLVANVPYHFRLVVSNAAGGGLWVRPDFG